MSELAYRINHRLEDIRVLLVGASDTLDSRPWWQLIDAVDNPLIASFTPVIIGVGLAIDILTGRNEIR